MKIRLFNTFKMTIAIAGVISIFTSCAKWDEFKKYTENGEIAYSGKLDSVRIYSGNERIKITAMLPADPKIVKARIFWNNRTDSVEVPIDVSKGRAFSYILPASEGFRSYIMYTYDAQGNRSVPVYATGTALGTRYQKSIANRVVTNAVNVNTATTINWVAADLTTNPLFTEVQYQSTSGEKTVKVLATADVATIGDLDPVAKTFKYRTAYQPVNNIDTFFTDYKTAGIYKDETSAFLPNARNPIATSAESPRWAIPANWITNAAVKNYKHTDGKSYGGVDLWHRSISMEAGWSWDNLDSFTNGKVYQSPELPAAHYMIELDVADCSAGGRFYLVATEGNEISNIEAIESSLAYARTNTPGTHRISFELKESKKVSIGLVASLTNPKDRGEWGGEFFRARAFRLLKLDAL
ncbi:DUF4998 domain-containing protein [Desertivirga brevis]|uniref:DUF4998 domain-containing protein n=1 Tax=Desertivirga brevis TaxID=2810310 RepID=UPI001A97C94C|nr:DUF4998 domain-containing protein [Pedobacter sp. SYSU D00873]